MVKIIDGKKIAERINRETREEIKKLPNLKPHLAIILIGEKEDSKIYIKLKEKKAKELEIQTSLYKFSVNNREEEILETIDFLNKDKNVQSILVQLPLPKKFNTDKIISAIQPEKDVDRFHPKNFKKLLTTCQNKEVLPPVLEVVLEILKEINFNSKDKKATVISNALIFGQGLKKVLECSGLKTKKTNLKDKKMKEKMAKADVLISAVGRPKFIKKNMIKKNAVLIDIGINKKGKKVTGDIDFDKVKDVASYITPVPGGVGPITVAMLLKNVVALSKKNR